MPDAGKDGIVNKPLTTTKLVDRPGGNNNQNAEKDEKIIKESIKNLVLNHTTR